MVTLFVYSLVLFQYHRILLTDPTPVNSIPVANDQPTQIPVFSPRRQLNTPTSVPTKAASATAFPTPLGEWGKSVQIDEHTWTMRIAEDERMATPQEIFAALNEYRRKKGSQVLTWDNKLADYAQTRANYFYEIKDMDGHKGFSNFLENEDGFNKLGFNELGENASIGYRMLGVHIIEWIYAGDEPHDRNQLNNKWNYVGIGVKGTATCLIFGTGKY